MKRTRISVFGLSFAILLLFGAFAVLFLIAWFGEKSLGTKAAATAGLAAALWLRFRIVSVYSSGAMLIFSDGARDHYLSLADVVEVSPRAALGSVRFLAISYHKKRWGLSWIGRVWTLVPQGNTDPFRLSSTGFRDR